jgi:hypothetical protein
MRQMEESILNLIGENTIIEDLGTLKASSSFNEEWYEYEKGGF